MINQEDHPSSFFFSPVSIQEITQGNLCQYRHTASIHTIVFDSRKLIGDNHHHTMFIAIQGDHHDGHDYISFVYGQGVRCFLIEKEFPALQILVPEATVIQVSSSIKALQALAQAHRKKFSIPLIAITGSNGKTIVKEWLSQCLATSYYVIKSPQSYNSQVGVPCSVLPMHEKHQLGIFEAGISQPGEMQRLWHILRPSVGIFTNIGSAHDAYFISQTQKIKEKAHLFQNCKTIIYCQDHQLIHHVLQQQYSVHQRMAWSYQKSSQAVFIVQKISTAYGTTDITIRYHGDQHTFRLPFQEASLLENAIHVLVCCLILYPSMVARLPSLLYTLQPVAMRLTLKEGMHGCYLLDDTYNNDFVGFVAALEAMLPYARKEKMVILSDMLQTGWSAALLYAKVAALCRKYGVRYGIGIGPLISEHRACFTGLDFQTYTSVDHFLKEMPLLKDRFILIKGARVFALEQVVDALQKKIHHTVLEVNLKALIHNFYFFRQKLKRSTQLMAMVKAAAYGSSTFEVAQLLAYHQVDYLGVAYTDEGILLRKKGIRLPILVMNVTPFCFEKVLTYDLTMQVYSLALLKVLDIFSKKHAQPMAIHLKIDTGMHRLGIAANEFTAVLKILQENAYIQTVGILSHLASADLPSHDDFTHAQAQKFLDAVCFFEKRLQKTLLKHLLNTAGIIRFPAYQWDMVRLGIGLYGVGVDTMVQKDLRVVNTLKTIILQIKSIPANVTVGYHRKGIVMQAMTLAIIAIGYADGLSRSLSDGQGKVWVKGAIVPIVGYICMDTCMIDVTGIPVEVGDEVIIFGETYDVFLGAKAQNTIAYEVFTKMSDRVKRVYITA